MNEIPILSAADGAPWEARWMAELPDAGTGARIVRRCVDVVDLLAVAAAGQGRAVLASSRLRRFDADALDRLAASGVAVVAVIESGDSLAATRLQELGVQHLVGADAAAEVVASVIDTALADRQGERAGAEASRSFALPTSRVHPVAASAHDGPAIWAGRRGTVVAVWGPTGGPGRTTVALNMAHEVSELGAESLLIDADVYGGLAATMLGLLDESPGVAAAARQASGGRLDVSALAALCWQIAPSFRVLTGLPRTDRWPELRPSAIAAVLGAARQLADYTFVDLGFCLETDEELSFDTLAPRRNGATLAVLDEADLILAVGSGDVAGVHRLARAMSELRDAEIDAPAWIVLNKTRGSAAYSRVGAQLTEAMERFTGQPPATMLPLDVASCDAAALKGQPLALAAPNSPLRAALVELACAVSGRRVAVPGRRRASRHSSTR